jgi:hypothetical protein
MLSSGNLKMAQHTTYDLLGRCSSSCSRLEKELHTRDTLKGDIHLRKELHETVDRFRQWESNYELSIPLVGRSNIRPNTETLPHIEVPLKSTLTALWYFFRKGLSRAHLLQHETSANAHTQSLSLLHRKLLKARLHRLKQANPTLWQHLYLSMSSNF